MAITFYFVDALASGSTHGNLQTRGTAPGSVATFTTNPCGWNVGQNTSPNYSPLRVGTEQPRATAFQTSPALPDGSNPGTQDCFRSDNQITGTFANANWTIAIGVRAVTLAATGSGRLRIRVWKSVNADGSSGTELTNNSGNPILTGSFSNLTTTTQQNLTVTWSPGATLTFSGEYLFIQIAIEIQTASGGNNADCNFRVDATNSRVTSSTFAFVRECDDTVAVTETVTPRQFVGRKITDTIAVSDVLSGINPNIFIRTASDTPSMSDALSKASSIVRPAADTASIGDSIKRVVPTFVRSAIDTQSIGDSSVRTGSYGRKPSDTGSTSDVLSRQYTKGASAADTCASTDAIARVVPTFVRTCADTCAITDASTRTTFRSRPASDTCTISDATLAIKQRIYYGTFADTLSVSDSVTRYTPTKVRSDADTPAVSDSLLRDSTKGGAPLSDYIGEALDRMLAPTPQSILGSRLKRLYRTTTYSSPNRFWTDDIGSGDSLSCTNGTTLSTPAGNEGVGTPTTHGYGPGSVSLGGATIRNLLVFGAFKCASNIGSSDPGLNFIDSTTWMVNVRVSDGKVAAYAGATHTGTAVSNASVLDGKWHTWSFWYTNDGDAGHGKLYIDGVLQTTQQTAGGNITPTTGLSLAWMVSTTGSDMSAAMTGVAMGVAGTKFTAFEVAQINAYLSDWTNIYGRSYERASIDTPYAGDVIITRDFMVLSSRSLTSFWADYGGAPWAGHESGGASGSRALSSGSVPAPTVGTPRGSYRSAVYSSTAMWPAPQTIFGANCLRSYGKTYNGSTGVWTDDSGNFNTAYLSPLPIPSATTINGNTAVSFAGNSCLRCAAPGALLASGTKMTVWAIAKTSTQQQTSIIWGQAYNDYGWVLATGIWGGTSTTGAYSIALGYDAAYGIGPAIDSARTFQDGNPHTLVATYDATISQLTFYIDGNQIDQTTLSPGGNVGDNSATDVPGIGSELRYVTGSYYVRDYFTGVIACPGFANVVATSSQLSQLHTYLKSYAGIP